MKLETIFEWIIAISLIAPFFWPSAKVRFYAHYSLIILGLSGMISFIITILKNPDSKEPAWDDFSLYFIITFIIICFLVYLRRSTVKKEEKSSNDLGLF